MQHRFVNRYVDKRRRRLKEAVLHYFIGIEALKAYPIFFPARCFVGPVAMPYTGEQEKTGALGNFKRRSFRRLEHALPLCSKYNIVGIQYAAGVPGKGVAYGVL